MGGEGRGGDRRLPLCASHTGPRPSMASTVCLNTGLFGCCMEVVRLDIMCLALRPTGDWGNPRWPRVARAGNLELPRRNDVILETLGQLRSCEGPLFQSKCLKKFLCHYYEN